MTVFQLSTSPTQLQSGYAGGFLVHNNGTNPAYLGLDSSVSHGTQSITLVPGASLTWNGELWGVCDNGLPTTLETALQGQGHSAPGPSSVVASLSGPVAIDQANNGVSVPGGIGVNGNVATLPSNKLTLLSTQTLAYNAAAGTYQTLNAGPPGLDVSAYASVLIIFSVPTALGAATPATHLDITLTQVVPDVSYSTADQEFASFLPNANVTQIGSVQVPLVGGQVLLQMVLTKLASAAGGNVTAQIYGSHEIIPTTRYLSWAGATGTGMGDNVISNVSAATDTIVSSANGAAELEVLAGTGSSAGSANLQVASAGAWVPFTGSGAIAAGGSAHLSLRLPNRPILLHVAPTAGSLIASLTQ